jgi:hypothetical protein
VTSLTASAFAVTTLEASVVGPVNTITVTAFTR